MLKDRIKITFTPDIRLRPDCGEWMWRFCKQFWQATNGKFILQFDEWVPWSEYPHTDKDIGIFRVLRVINE